MTEALAAVKEYAPVVVAAAGVVTLVIIYRQMLVQTRLYRARLVLDRYQLYQKSFEPITETHVREAELYPDLYFDRELFERRYKDDAEAMKKYLIFTRMYRSLLFLHKLDNRDMRKVFDASGYERWARSLLGEEEFQDVRAYFGKFYHQFDRYLARLEAGPEKKKEQER